jgi:type II secretory pathway component PulC
MNWPLWGGLLAILLLSKHIWVLFAPVEHAVPGGTVSAQSAQAEQLFGNVSTTTASASLNGIRPIGIFASKTNGFAVMMTESGQVGVGLGGEVAPGIKLVETNADHVILERNGTRQRVDLSKAPAATGGITPATGNAAPARDTAPQRSDPVAAAKGQFMEQLSPEQRDMLQQQRQEFTRGRP